MNTLNDIRKIRPFGLAISVVLLVLIWLLDIKTPNDFSVFLLTLLPLAAITWLFGRSIGIFAAIVAALASFVGERFLESGHSGPEVLISNGLMKTALFLACAIGVSSLRGTMDTLHRRNVELTEANEIKTAFLSMASHDLRTPLSTMMLTSEIMRNSLQHDQQVDRETLLKFLYQSASATSRMRAMVDNYLDLGRIESGVFTVHPQWINLAEWVTGICDSHQLLGQARGVSLVCEAMPTPDYEIDPSVLEAALMNLITNAIKYSGEGGRIVIKAKPASGGFQISVNDSGPGLGEDPGRVFKKFYRGSNGKVAPGQRSAGLGLYIVQQAVEAHGGTISAGNAPDGGAKFEIFIPSNSRQRELI